MAETPASPTEHTEHTIDEHGLAQRSGGLDNVALFQLFIWFLFVLCRIQQVFDRFDKDGGGSLDRTEMLPLCVK